MKKYLIISLVAILIIIGVIIYFATREDEGGETLTKLSVNEVTRSVFYAPQYLAISNGFFKEEGIEIELTTGQGADKVMTAVLAGQSDIGFARTRGSNICI